MNETEEVAKRLYEACLSGSVETLNALLEKDQLILNRVSSIECFSSDTPLHVAVSCGHLEFTKALLRWKPKLADELDSRRCSSLHLASTEGHFEITIEYLLGMKSVKDHANDKNQNGSTALDVVEHCPNRDLKTMEIREFLLQAGVQRSHCDGPKPNPELAPNNPPRTQHCGKPGVVLMGCISWFWNKFKVDRDWLKQTIEYLLGMKSIKDHANDKNQNGSTALDVVEHCPNRDLKTMEIREFLLQAGVQRSHCDGPKPNPELAPNNPPRTQHCGKPGVVLMGCISWFWDKFKVDRDWLKQARITAEYKR
ncbi:hypothetical protein RHSIM_Rhsim03G0059800 [Rhododendron simsii]|uniref:Uncharacterized protein n=1 Tax=Rhododendron simsii TaxID=118357 RepID=A0A834LUQ5_RHOSS|nr:hypothetical protein RHSIM_Rhsim03G0059800 [Rhododendron simsii]